MTSPATFPQLRGQGWSVHKRPTFSTRVAGHVSGREVRTPLYAYPLYEFEVVFDALDSNGLWPGAGVNSLETLVGFYLQQQGQFGSFLYVDPNDQIASRQGVGTGDGSMTAFTMQRNFGGYAEPVSWVSSISNVYLNDVAQPNGWSLTQPNTLSFQSPPSIDAVIAADFSFAFLCRFLDDQSDFENIANGLWCVESLKFRSVRS